MRAEDILRQKLDDAMSDLDMFVEMYNAREKESADLRRKVAHLTAEVKRLRECLHIAGLQAFMRDKSPEEVAAHLQMVIVSHTEATDKAEAEVKRLRGEREGKAEGLRETEYVAGYRDGWADCVSRVVTSLTPTDLHTMVPEDGGSDD